MSQIRMHVAVVDLLFVISVGLAVVAHYLPAPWTLVLELQFPFAVGAFWFFLERLKCPHCARRLSQDFPSGALLALPFARQPCKQCGKII